jgi:hypothetical protein
VASRFQEVDQSVPSAWNWIAIERVFKVELFDCEVKTPIVAGSASDHDILGFVPTAPSVRYQVIELKPHALESRVL